MHVRVSAAFSPVKFCSPCHVYFKVKLVVIKDWEETAKTTHTSRPYALMLAKTLYSDTDLEPRLIAVHPTPPSKKGL
jgi:hypothetical protein